MVDISRSTAGVELSPVVSNEIWAAAQRGSAVMRLATRIDMPGSGVSVPMVTGDAVADFVNEGAEKPVSNPTLDNKLITPHKIAVTSLFTEEYARDQARMFDELVRRLPDALARRFDQAVFHDTTVRAGFDRLADADAVTLDGTDTYGDLVNAYGAIASHNGVLNGWALAPKSNTLLLGARDGNGVPLFVPNVQTDGAPASLLGAPAFIAPAVHKADAAGDDGEVLGFAGDWTSAFYGTVGSIQTKISGEASINYGGTVYHLFQRNMVAVICEVEVAFGVRDLGHFVKLVGSNTVA